MQSIVYYFRVTPGQVTEGLQACVKVDMVFNLGMTYSDFPYVFLPKAE